jgi:hypothetical protein
MERTTSVRRRERGGAVGTILAIIGGLVLAGLIAAFIALYFVARHVKVDVKSGAEGKQVQIETPFGGLKVRKAEDIAQELNLPVYPGATPTEDSASVSFWGGTEEEQEGFDLTIATFHTDDPMEKVDAWYRQQLSSEFRREPGRIVGTRGDRRERHIHVRSDRDGVVFIHQRGGRTRGVGLEPRRGRVKIALFDVWEGRGQ